VLTSVRELEYFGEKARNAVIPIYREMIQSNDAGIFCCGCLGLMNLGEKTAIPVDRLLKVLVNRKDYAVSVRAMVGPISAKIQEDSILFLQACTL